MFDINDKPFCTFSRMNGDFKRCFKLDVDGVITDIGSEGNDNERFWSFDGAILTLYSSLKNVTSVFYVKEAGEEQCLLEGYFMDKIPLKIVCVKNRSDLFENKTKYHHGDLIASGQLVVGSHTYGRLSLYDKSNEKIVIGDYCSIAKKVDWFLMNHRIDLVSTYPFNSLRVFWSDNEAEHNDHVSKGMIIVGNDVWIGMSAKIMSGVIIGDGAVIAAGAVVTKNVQPYSIVAGNPAKHIKYRIENEEDRRKMQEIAWWDWSEEKVSENVDKIMNPDIKAFIEEFYVEK